MNQATKIKKNEQETRRKNLYIYNFFGKHQKTSWLGYDLFVFIYFDKNTNTHKYTKRKFGRKVSV